MRLIDADNIRYRNAKLEFPNGHKTHGYFAVVTSVEIKDAPTVEAEPVRHGEWEFGELDIVGVPVKFSVCGFSLNMVDPVMWLDYPAHKYCGCCGAKMDGKEKVE